MKMSFKEYVHHISQKYRLAVAISVIKSKPNNLTIDEYLLQLQNKINNQDFDPNETVCSEDFNFDDDDILDENYEENIKKDECDKSNDNRIDLSTKENVSQCSPTILNDFVFGNGSIEPNAERETSLGDTLRLLNKVTAVLEEEPKDIRNHSQTTYCESQEACHEDGVTHYETINETKNKYNDTDTQETQLYTLHGFTQDYSHVSQSQCEYLVIADKYIRTYRDNIHDKKEVADTDAEIFDNARQMFTENLVTTPNIVTQNDIVMSNEKVAPYNALAMNTNMDNNFNNTEVLQDQNVTDYTENKNVSDGDEGRKDTTNNSKEIEIANVDDTEMIILSLDKELARNMSIATKAEILNTKTRNDKNTRKRLELNIDTNKNVKDANYTNCTPLLSFDSQKTRNETHNEKENKEHLSNKLEDIKETCNCSQGSQLNENPDNNEQEDDNIENDDNMDIDETGSDENTQEKVPFKVIEELTRVKNFVNRKNRKYDGCSTDSGYRSDSQVRSSLKTLSQHGAWLNQSAHCLFNYILQTSAADHIVKEIAQVLGKLIDRLHEDENYPPFLEELLGTVDRLLLDLRAGDDWRADVIITKDEIIHRLLLLNKSKHILRYSIEKTTIILEELHTNLTQENLYELTDIVEMENSCYIFQLLETLLKRYMKVKDSQSTQNSQEESFPTRSSLTELWRKKWYPNSTKDIKIENKTCVLKRCSEVLNKIIVGCMDGYSLVVFAALQCFNLMQV